MIKYILSFQLISPKMNLIERVCLFLKFLDTAGRQTEENPLKKIKKKIILVLAAAMLLGMIQGSFAFGGVSSEKDERKAVHVLPRLAATYVIPGNIVSFKFHLVCEEDAGASNGLRIKVVSYGGVYKYTSDNYLRISNFTINSRRFDKDLQSAEVSYSFDAASAGGRASSFSDTAALSIPEHGTAFTPKISMSASPMEEHEKTAFIKALYSQSFPSSSLWLGRINLPPANEKGTNGVELGRDFTAAPKETLVIQVGRLPESNSSINISAEYVNGMDGCWMAEVHEYERITVCLGENGKYPVKIKASVNRVPPDDETKEGEGEGEGEGIAFNIQR